MRAWVEENNAYYWTKGRRFKPQFKKWKLTLWETVYIKYCCNLGTDAVIADFYYNSPQFRYAHKRGLTEDEFVLFLLSNNLREVNR